MSLQDRIREILQEALRVAGAGILLEVLEREVARALGRPVSRKSLEGLLVRNPERFEVDAGGRWRLRAQIEEIEPEEPGPPSRRQPLERGRFVIFDLETLSRETAGEETEIIEIALARYEEGQRVETWQTFVRPGAAIPPFITELTTIRDEDVADAPSQNEALEEFFAPVQGLPVIAHNGLAFDGAVLHNVAERVGVPVPQDFLLLDTLPLARLFHQNPGQRHTNENLAQHYGCHRPGAHRADVDVEMLGGIVEGLLRETNRHPLGGMVFELLRKAGDPWADLLDPPIVPLDVTTCLDCLGEAQAPLLPERIAPAGPGSDEAPIEALFDEMICQGRDRREPQVRFARLAGEALRSGRFAVAEAGTGTGKSLGYLIPAALHARAAGKSVVVSTYTRVLQTQLLEKDLAFLAELVPGLTSAVLKGRGNYLSLARLREELVDALEEDRLAPVRAWTLGTLASFALTSPDGDLEPLRPAISGIEDALNARGEGWTLVNTMRASAEGGRTEKLPGGRRDFYATARANAMRADVVVLNHSLLLTQAVMAGDQLPDLFSPFVVCDEAHNREDAATSVLTYEVSEETVRRLLRAVYDRPRRAGLLASARKAGLPASDEALKAAAAAVVKAETHVDNLSQRLRSFVEAHTVASREELARYGAAVEIRPTVLQGPGGPSLRESAMALLEVLGHLRSALEETARSCSEHALTDKGSRWAARAIRLARSLAFDFFELEKTFRWFWTFTEATSYVRVIEIEAEVDRRAPWKIDGVPIDVSALLQTGFRPAFATQGRPWRSHSPRQAATWRHLSSGRLTIVAGSDYRLRVGPRHVPTHL